MIAFPAHATVEQIKKTLHADLRLVEEFLVLRVGGVVGNNGDSLMDLGFEPGQMDAYIDVSVDPTQTGGDYRMPDNIYVEVFDGEPTLCAHAACVPSRADVPRCPPCHCLCPPPSSTVYTQRHEVRWCGSLWLSFARRTASCT